MGWIPNGRMVLWCILRSACTMGDSGGPIRAVAHPERSSMNLALSWRRARRFLKHDIWHLPETLPQGRRTSLLSLLRILVLAGRGFLGDGLQMRASALTYYSLLSVVPALALAFGIAKGFGLQAALENALRDKLAGQEDVLEKAIIFAQSMLENTRGGLVAGVGVLLLIWAVIQLLGNIEKSFNAIWGVEQGRNPVRRLTDYLAIVIVAPLLFLVSSSAAVFISGRVTEALAAIGILDPVSWLVRAGLELLPFLFIWLLLSLLYLAMPNTRVSLRAALAAGVVAGTLFQILQLVYIGFQVGVSRYNTIYGSFAALPLFLIWLRMSWLIVLVGAEVSFAVDNAGDYGRERAAGRANLHQRRLLAIRLAASCAGRFKRKEEPAAASVLAEELGVPTRLVQGTLSTLVRAGVLTEVRNGGDKTGGFQPAVDPGAMTIVGVGGAFDRSWMEIPDDGLTDEDEVDLVPEAALGELGARWRALADQMENSGENWTLERLAENLGD